MSCSGQTADKTGCGKPGGFKLFEGRCSTVLYIV